MFAARMLTPLLALVVFAGLATAPAEAADGQTSPAQAAKFVEDLGTRAVALLASYSEAEGAKAQEEFKALLRKGFEIDLIGRFVLGASWRSATREQQDEYLKLFATWVINSYSRRLGAYKGEKFHIIGSQPIAETDALIETQIDRPSGPPLKAGWRVRNIGGQMKIVDVVVEGVSMAVTQRQEFASVIQREGLDGLIRELKVRVDKL